MLSVTGNKEKNEERWLRTSLKATMKRSCVNIITDHSDTFVINQPFTSTFLCIYAVLLPKGTGCTCTAPACSLKSRYMVGVLVKTLDYGGGETEICIFSQMRTYTQPQALNILYKTESTVMQSFN